MTLPYRREHEFDKKQFGYLDVVATGSTTIRVTTKISNGKRLDGDNFRVSIAIKDASGSVLAAVDQRAGLNASFGGGAVERTLTTNIDIAPHETSEVSTVQAQFSHSDKVDDEQFWKTVKEVAKKIWEAYQAQES